MFKNPVGLAILAAIVIGGGVWFYFYETDPLHTSCNKLMAAWDTKGQQAADALYDSLSDRAKAKTTRAGTRMYLDSVCRTETENEDLALTSLRDRMERDLSAR